MFLISVISDTKIYHWYISCNLTEISDMSYNYICLFQTVNLSSGRDSGGETFRWAHPEPNTNRRLRPNAFSSLADHLF